MGHLPLFHPILSRHHLLPPAARLLELSVENLEETLASLCISRILPVLHGYQELFPIDGGVERSRGEAGELRRRPPRGLCHGIADEYTMEGVLTVRV